MRARWGRPRWGAAILAAACALAPRAVAQDGPPDATESSGAIQLTDEKVLTLVGLRGDTILRTGEAGAIEFTSVRADDRKTPLPVSVWFDDSGVTLRAPEGQADAPRVLDITFPPGFVVKVNTEDAAILGSGLNASLAIKGARVAIDIRGLNGNVAVETSTAKIRVEGITGNASIRASDAEIVASGIHGLLTVRAVRGTLAVSSAHGLDADLESLTSKIEVLEDPVQIRGRGGTLALSLAPNGGAITLNGTTLKLERCGGTLVVKSDTTVEFKQCKAELRFEGDAAALVGDGNTGSVEARTRSAAVVLANITGTTRLDGDGLDVRLEHLAGDLTIKASASTINATDISGVVDVESDGGGISMQQTAGEVKIRSLAGDVTILHAAGPVQVETDQGRVEVSWSSMSFQGRSDIKNESGVVVAHFPSQGGVRIEAESRYAEVESHLAKVVVTPDRHKAQGAVGYPGGPVVSIVAGGVVQLLGGGAAEPAPGDNN